MQADRTRDGGAIGEMEGLVRFAQVDIDAHPEIARGYNISSIPAVLRFEDGEVTNWSLGAKPD